MAKDVLLYRFIHVSAHGKEVLRTIFIPRHFFNACLKSQNPFLISKVALMNLLGFMMMLVNSLVHLI